MIPVSMTVPRHIHRNVTFRRLLYDAWQFIRSQRPVTFEELQVGQRLAESVETLEAWMVLPRNTVLGRTHLEKLRNFQRLAGLKEPISVYEEVGP